MLRFEMEIDLTQLKKLTKKVDGISDRMKNRLFDVVEVDLNLARADMIQTYLSNSETTSRGLARRSGNLIASWRVTMKERAADFEGKLFQDERYRSKIYAPVHEYGATITAKRVRNLAIPLTEEARLAATPRKFNDIFPVRSKRGNLLLVRRSGKTLEPMYKLQPSVRIPPRPFIRPTSEKWFPIILRDMQQEMIAMQKELEA